MFCFVLTFCLTVSWVVVGTVGGQCPAAVWNIPSFPGWPWHFTVTGYVPAVFLGRLVFGEYLAEIHQPSGGPPVYVWVYPHLGEKSNSSSPCLPWCYTSNHGLLTKQTNKKPNQKNNKNQGPVTCRACMLLTLLGIDGVWESPFLLLMASPSLLEFRSMARLNVYVL